MSLILPNDIAPNTPAQAGPVEQNYNVIEDYINSEVIHRDGSVAMAAQLLLVGDPTQPLAAAAKQYVDAILPVGVILPFGGVAAPAGKWALCNGASLSQSTYPKLFSVLGNRYGTAAAGQFLLPNLQGKIPIGADPAQARFDTTGKTGGTWEVPVPLHSHTMSHTHTINHDHAQFTAVGGDHSHLGRFASAQALGAGGTWYAHRLADISGTVATELTGQSGGLSIPINVPAYNGSSGGSSATNTSNSGTDNAEHLPPYVVLTHIIRID